MKALLAVFAVVSTLMPDVAQSAARCSHPDPEICERMALRDAKRKRETEAAQKRINDRCEKLGSARIGLNAEGVLKSCWGKPNKINVTINARGKHEQWVYDGGYLYLDDGIVTSIQTSR